MNSFVSDGNPSNLRDIDFPVKKVSIDLSYIIFGVLLNMLSVSLESIH